MIRSMTGYGRGETVKFDRKFVVEIKSVNHRYNDIVIKIPKIMNSFEDRIRKIISSSISRGKTDVYISFQSFSKKDIKINFNEALSDTYFNEMKQISQRYNLEDNNYLNYLLNFDGILTLDNTSYDDDTLNEMWEALQEALHMSITQSLLMREAEGKNLKNDIVSKASLIKSFVEEIEKRYPLVLDEYRERLKQRITEVLDDIELDETRMMTEIALIADKSSIDEELIRLFSHIDQLLEILSHGGTVGRKLDFLIQEMNREVNTIGSKSNDIIITRNVIELKSEIEKIREQIQNIE